MFDLPVSDIDKGLFLALALFILSLNLYNPPTELHIGDMLGSGTRELSICSDNKFFKYTTYTLIRLTASYFLDKTSSGSSVLKLNTFCKILVSRNHYKWK